MSGELLVPFGVGTTPDAVVEAVEKAAEERPEIKRPNTSSVEDFFGGLADLYKRATGDDVMEEG